MLNFFRSASIIAAPLALLAWVTPAGARIAINGVAYNGLSSTGSALSALNGVGVEAVIISDAAAR